MVNLLTIQDLVQQISETISSVLNMEVIISDNDYHIIGDTKSHFDDDVKMVKDTYVIGKVMKSGKTIIVEGIEQSDNCSKCNEKEKCNLKAMICIPIMKGKIVLGSIGMIATSIESRTTLLDNKDNLVEFLYRMADLIIGKVLEQEALEKLNIAKNQVISIIDTIDDGIIVIDENGSIIYTNSVINEAFDIKNVEFKGKKIQELMMQPYIEELIENKKQFLNIEVKINENVREFHAMVSSKALIFEEGNEGSILTFRKMSDIYKVVNKISINNLSTTFSEIIGKSYEIEQAKIKSKQVVNSDSTVLILGESGTGKELFARAIHYDSNRKEKPFVAFNCAAIPESLFESELFGYEEGSFTGAAKGGRIGKFQLAEGGTIFLDEIGDVPIHLQIKLLRVLQEKSFERIGGQKSTALNVRVITATNKNLEKMVENGEFREDLYYRLNVIPINIPPLRERVGDVKILIKHFLKAYNKKLSKDIIGFNKNVESVLLKNMWKGNIRELENVIEYAVNMETTDYITLKSIPQRIKSNQKIELINKNIITLEEMEKQLIQDAINQYEKSVTGKNKAAAVLGIGTATLYRKIKKYNIE